jgi:ammonium transporter, Amt family
VRRRWWKLALTPVLSAPLVIGLAAPAWAQEATPSPVEQLGIQTNLLWVVLGAVLVVFMQAGFALVETGFTQAKNAAHTVTMNFAIFGLGFIGFFFVGYGLMFGGYTLPLIGFDTPLGRFR